MEQELIRLREEYENNPRNRQAADKYFSLLIKQGRLAESVKEFIDDFLAYERNAVLVSLQREDVDLERLRADYQATLRLHEYMRGLISIGGNKESKDERR